MPILISKVAFSGVRNFTNNEHINVFMNMITNLTLIGLGFLRVLFSGGGGGGGDSQFDRSFIFRKELI